MAPEVTIAWRIAEQAAKDWGGQPSTSLSVAIERAIWQAARPLVAALEMAEHLLDDDPGIHEVLARALSGWISTEGSKAAPSAKNPAQADYDEARLSGDMGLEDHECLAGKCEAAIVALWAECERLSRLVVREVDEGVTSLCP